MCDFNTESEYTTEFHTCISVDIDTFGTYPAERKCKTER